MLCCTLNITSYDCSFSLLLANMRLELKSILSSFCRCHTHATYLIAAAAVAVVISQCKQAHSARCESGVRHMNKSVCVRVCAITVHEMVWARIERFPRALARYWQKSVAGQIFAKQTHVAKKTSARARLIRSFFPLAFWIQLSLSQQHFQEKKKQLPVCLKWK